MRTIGEGLEQAGSEFEDSYDQMIQAIEDEGQMSDSAEDYFEEAHSYISEELGDFQTGVLSAHQKIQDASDIDDAEGATESLEDAGQSLANAYNAARVAYNKAEGVISNGDEAITSDISAIDMSQDMSELHDAVDQKEQAFEMYQDVLDTASAEVAEFYEDHGLISNMDFGLEHQQPEELDF
ncbi:hypothetical protein GKQ38_02595 [Candidatus Nanohaloarchaea archaeon]|nr:hypothetical protein GKQ38_02595 [Candidatus Nanohaloarchaea archaeon]